MLNLCDVMGVTKIAAPANMGICDASPTTRAQRYRAEVGFEH